MFEGETGGMYVYYDELALTCADLNYGLHNSADYKHFFRPAGPKDPKKLTLINYVDETIVRIETFAR